MPHLLFLPQRLRGNNLPTFVTAAFKHAPAARAFHSGAEAVHLGARAFFGLVSAFHGLKLLLKNLGYSV